MKEKTNRTRYVGLRLTAEEFERINNVCQHTTTPRISECLRRRLFDRPLTTLQRNQSLDDCMQELMQLRNELNAIGNNFNQAIRLLHTFNHMAAVLDFIEGYHADRRKLFAITDNLQTRLNHLGDIWLQ